MFGDDSNSGEEEARLAGTRKMDDGGKKIMQVERKYGKRRTPWKEDRQLQEGESTVSERMDERRRREHHCSGKAAMKPRIIGKDSLGARWGDFDGGQLPNC